MTTGHADDRAKHAIDFRGPFVRQQLPGGWTALYRMAPQGSDVVISEMRLIPTASYDPDGPHNVPPGGLPSRTPRDARPGVARRLFKARLKATLATGTATRDGGDRLRDLQGLGRLTLELFPGTASMTLADLEEMDVAGTGASITPERISAAKERTAAWFELVEAGAAQRWGPWRKAFARSRKNLAIPGDPRLRLAQTAALYVEALAGGEAAPNVRVAKSQGRKATQVRDDILKARRLGFLTGTQTQGRAAGELTPAAIDILEETPST